MTWSITRQTPWGPFTVEGSDAGVTSARFVNGTSTSDPLAVGPELDRYLSGESQHLDVPLALAGTPYQQRVWEAVRQIPFGETRTYGAIAADLGSVARAVGGANGANPAALFIPCHRVIGGDGSLTGYAWGVDVKRGLLDHEQGHQRLL